MAYLIESLIRNRPQIKETHDENSDDYNNLLILEKKIEELIDKGLLSDREMWILDLLSLGYSVGDISKKLGHDRNLITKLIKSTTDKIGFFLGGSFTDDGFLEYMQETHRLTDKQVETLKSYINGKYHNKISRKMNNAK